MTSPAPAAGVEGARACGACKNWRPFDASRIWGECGECEFRHRPSLTHCDEGFECDLFASRARLGEEGDAP